MANKYPVSMDDIMVAIKELSKETSERFDKMDDRLEMNDSKLNVIQNDIKLLNEKLTILNDEHLNNRAEIKQLKKIL